MFSLKILDGSQAEFSLNRPDVEGYILGRSDSQGMPMPDIDLAEYEGRQRGVSRRHAAIVNFQGGIYIIDLGSVNGTFINNRRLEADIPWLLNDGDRITLGDLDMLISYANP